MLKEGLQDTCLRILKALRTYLDRTQIMALCACKTIHLHKWLSRQRIPLKLEDCSWISIWHLTEYLCPKREWAHSAMAFLVFFPVWGNWFCWFRCQTCRWICSTGLGWAQLGRNMAREQERQGGKTSHAPPLTSRNLKDSHAQDVFVLCLGTQRRYLGNDKSHRPTVFFITY